MNIFCLSSRAEGFPNVVAEAMAMQVSPVVTEVGDAALIFKVTGQVVPEKVSVALANALIAFVDLTRKHRNALGTRARKAIEDNAIKLVVR
jgi:glycosyltransferase involved in cell wall biosynthesis